MNMGARLFHYIRGVFQLLYKQGTTSPAYQPAVDKRLNITKGPAVGTADITVSTLTAGNLTPGSITINNTSTAKTPPIDFPSWVRQN